MLEMYHFDRALTVAEDDFPSPSFRVFSSQIMHGILGDGVGRRRGGSRRRDVHHPGILYVASSHSQKLGGLFTSTSDV